MKLEIMAYSGAIECDYKNGPNWDEDCYSQWSHPEYLVEIKNKSELKKAILEFIEKELSGNIIKDHFSYNEGEELIIETLVNSINKRPSKTEFRNWIKRIPESIWIKDTAFCCILNNEKLTSKEILEMFKDNLVDY